MQERGSVGDAEMLFPMADGAERLQVSFSVVIVFAVLVVYVEQAEIVMLKATSLADILTPHAMRALGIHPPASLPPFVFYPCGNAAPASSSVGLVSHVANLDARATHNTGSGPIFSVDV